MDIYYLRKSIAECTCMDIHAWISMWIFSLIWIIEDRHPKIMYIYVDIRGFLEIHAWICYGFPDQSFGLGHKGLPHFRLCQFFWNTLHRLRLKQA